MKFQSLLLSAAAILVVSASAANAAEAVNIYQRQLANVTSGLTTTVTNPAIYALGSITTLVSFVVIGVAMTAVKLLSRGKKQ